VLVQQIVLSDLNCLFSFQVLSKMLTELSERTNSVSGSVRDAAATMNTGVKDLITRAAACSEGSRPNHPQA